MGCVSSKGISHRAVCVLHGVVIDDSIHVMILRDQRKKTQSCCYRPREPHPLLQRAIACEEEDTFVEMDALSLEEGNSSLKGRHHMKGSQQEPSSFAGGDDCIESNQ